MLRPLRSPRPAKRRTAQRQGEVARRRLGYGGLLRPPAEAQRRRVGGLFAESVCA